MKDILNNMRSSNAKTTETNDLGFGTKAYGRRNRLLNADGSYNVEKTGLPFLSSLNIYHTLITMTWTKFFVYVILLFLMVNLAFASIYYVVGLKHLAGIIGDTSFRRFMDAFFFSAQTLTTVGYGRISPVGSIASFVAAVESMLGLLGFAIATGVLYGRFSRASSRIIYSKKALIAPYKGGNAFMFRIANARKNELIEVEAELAFSMVDPETQSRSFHLLPLQLKKINFLTLNWTIVHPVNEDSPLFGLTETDMNERDVEFIILLKAFDNTFSQTVYSRASYKSEEIVWDARFSPMYSLPEDGVYRLELNKIGDYEPVPIANSLENTIYTEKISKHTSRD